MTGIYKKKSERYFSTYFKILGSFIPTYFFVFRNDKRKTNKFRYSIQSLFRLPLKESRSELPDNEKRGV